MIKNSFLDNCEYGAADINAITSRIVTSGVSPGFEDGKEYNLHCLNDLNASIVERGVAYANDTALRVDCIDGEYYVQNGIAFFGNGTVSEVVEPELLNITVGEEAYVYMVSDISNNSNYIAVNSAEPDYLNDTNIVMLAYIDTDGNITDRRTYARGKLPGFQSDFYTLKTKQITIPKSEVNDNGLTLNQTVTFDLESDSVTFMIFVNKEHTNCISLWIWDEETESFKCIVKTPDVSSNLSACYLYREINGSPLDSIILKSVRKSTASNTSYDFTLTSDVKTYVDIYYA